MHQTSNRWITIHRFFSGIGLQFLKDTHTSLQKCAKLHIIEIGDEVIPGIGNAWDEVLAVEIRGDFNGDGALNGLDIPGFKAALADPDAWTDKVARNAHRLGDFNGDGAFNGLDIPGFKTALAGAAVPEPVSIALVTAGMLGVLRAAVFACDATDVLYDPMYLKRSG